MTSIHCLFLDDFSKEHDSEAASLLDETLKDSKVGETASLLEPPMDHDHSKELLEQTLVEESPEKSKSHAYDDDFEMSSHASKHEGSEKVYYAMELFTTTARILLAAFFSAGITKFK